MSAALDILNGFNNATLAAMSDTAKNTAITQAFLDIDKTTYGSMANYAAADLAAHNLLQEAGATNGSQTGQIKRKRIGKREEEYATTPTADPLNGTFYGARFLKRQSQVAVGITNSGL